MKISAFSAFATIGLLLAVVSSTGRLQCSHCRSGPPQLSATASTTPADPPAVPCWSTRRAKSIRISTAPIQRRRYTITDADAQGRVVQRVHNNSSPVEAGEISSRRQLRVMPGVVMAR